MARLIDQQTEAMLNRAIHSELFASNLYRHVSNHLQRLGYFGAQKFFSGEANNELAHYQKIVGYMNDVGTVAQVPAIEAITDPVTSLEDAINVAYETELQLMRDYIKWYKACPCVVTQQFLLQYLEEQRKSVGEFGDLLARLKLAGGNPSAILLIDQELGNE